MGEEQVTWISLQGIEQNHGPQRSWADPSTTIICMRSQFLQNINGVIDTFKNQPVLNMRKGPCLSSRSVSLLFLLRWWERGSLVQEFLLPKMCKILLSKLSEQFLAPISPAVLSSTVCLPNLSPRAGFQLMSASFFLQAKGFTSDPCAGYLWKRVNGESCTTRWEMPSILSISVHYSLLLEVWQQWGGALGPNALWAQLSSPETSEPEMLRVLSTQTLPSLLAKFSSPTWGSGRDYLWDGIIRRQCLFINVILLCLVWTPVSISGWVKGGSARPAHPFGQSWPGFWLPASCCSLDACSRDGYYRFWPLLMALLLAAHVQ